MLYLYESDFLQGHFQESSVPSHRPQRRKPRYSPCFARSGGPYWKSKAAEPKALLPHGYTTLGFAGERYFVLLHWDPHDDTIRENRIYAGGL